MLDRRGVRAGAIAANIIGMCGLAGIWGSVDEDAVRAMMDVQRHRGPDGSGTFTPPGGAGVLGHQRLSIMDPAGGAQPIVSGDGRRAVVANGEIYNYPELRPQLAREHTIRTGSDSEAILHLYESEGAGAVGDLDGMWAFAIADGDRLLVGRDPIGIKPLYLGDTGEGLAFASELKALAPYCRDVREFPPGAVWDSAVGDLHTFYEVPDPEPEAGGAEEWAERIAETMERCVVKQRMSDVPVGAFLSGGLDSSVLAGLLARHKPELHTFSVGAEGSGDLVAARVVAQHLGTVHHEHVITRAEIEEHLPRIIWHLESYDQDLVRSAIPTYFTARLAARHVEVVLTGEGADELFAGYAYHKEIAGEDALRRELRRSITALHDVNLQRVDRMTMAHSIEGRPPFLDRDMIDLALRVPPRLKLAEGAVEDEKWILRKAFEDLLPHDIVWRGKQQFDEGSGMPDLMTAAAADLMGEGSSWRRYADEHSGARLRSAEECLYHQMLVEAFEHPRAVLDNVSRWTDRPAGIAA